ncbi:MAG: NAD(P)-dependent oxidoreductase [Alphaproteobacteria bacterium]
MKVGFIGLGTMGAPMAANLIEAGYALKVHDRDTAKARRLKEQGAAIARTPRLAARGSDVVITSLPGPKQVRAIWRGAEGLKIGLRPGAVWIDMTTNEPELVKRLAAELTPRGIAVLDAPVTGAVDGAIDGTLTIFVGGDARTLKRCRGLFRALGKKIVHAGPLGSGNAVKLVTNLLWFIHAAAIGEGLVLGVSAGVEPVTLWKAIRASVGDSFVAEHDVPSIFAGHYDPSFSLDLCLKDLGLAHGLAARLEVPLALGGRTQELFRQAKRRYGGQEGELHVVKLLEEKTHTPLRVPGDWPAPWERTRKPS